MSDDLRERVATVCGGNYIAADAAISIALEEAARVADAHRLPLGSFRAPYEIAAAIRAMIKPQPLP